LMGGTYGYITGTLIGMMMIYVQNFRQPTTKPGKD
jgi:hypothetical protein